jgi:DnaJ-class molecular chaperone
MENLYEILGVKENASQDEIKKAYRKASLKHHPDRGGDKGQFQKINSAYETLGDPQKRNQYNMQRSNPFMNNMNGRGFPTHENMNDIFKVFFGQNGGMPFGFPGGPNVQVFQNGRPVNFNRIRKPSAISKTIEISIEEAFSGVNKPIEIERWIQSNGTKRVEKETIYVPIPAGIDNQEIIVIQNKGNTINDNLRGDIKIFIRVINDSLFTRDGLNLIYKQEISLKEALIGFKFDIKHLSGKTYCINNNNGKVITPQYTKIIRNMGMKREREHPAPPMVGNLIIVFEVKFPESLSEEQQKMIDECL